MKSEIEKRTEYSSKQPEINKKNLFLFILALTGIFIFFEFCFFLQWSHFYLGDFRLVADKIKIPVSILPEIIFFLCIQIAIHCGYAVIIFLCTLQTYQFYISNPNLPKWVSDKIFKDAHILALIFWVLGILCVLFANQVYFPNSKFSVLMNILFGPVVAFYGFVLLAGFFLLTLSGVLYFTLKLEQKMMIGILICAFVAYDHLQEGVRDLSHSQNRTSHATTSHPNIILIGIDSLRPDFITFFGGMNHTPHLDQFLQTATVYREAYTPLARTFPSWVSILTGEYPIHHSVRTNLGESSHVNFQNTLSSILAKSGYQTIFATDETRFSNIDHRFGFDKIITPKIGFNDFLLGTINDFPLSNFLINTRLGKILFPYSYSNRAVFTTYDPNSFIDLLQQKLHEQCSKNHKPLFLAVHFCLPHYPYFWGKASADNQSLVNYKAAITRVDKQFYDFMQILSQNKLLENALVFVLSDHGEALELPGDRITESHLYLHPEKTIPKFYPPSLDDEKINQSAGHGTDVLSLSQYHVLLAKKYYQGGGIEKHAFSVDKNDPLVFLNDQLVSLIDLKPSILAFLKMADIHSDGKSLINNNQQSKQQADRYLFIESDFSSQSIRTLHPEMHDVLFQGVQFFQVNPKTTRLTVRKEMEALIYAAKQYAVLTKDWIIAIYPQKDGSHQVIVVNRKTGVWTNSLSDRFASNSPAAKLLALLKNYQRSPSF